ncbi:hypothetical protein Ddc_19451 [Ditylenchus destructor]|nr:hypothetical protein Ddc_19451 [Ditylenchus destructor]
MRWLCTFSSRSYLLAIAVSAVLCTYQIIVLSVKTIDVLMEAKIPVGAFARPDDIFRVFMENAHAYKMKVLRRDGSNVNVDRSKLEPTANMDRIVKKD